MISFKDMTFCNSDCMNTTCHRNFTKEVQEAAVKWWGSEDAPVSFSDFSPNCTDYQKARGDTE